jgi:hypothetical protein
MLFLEVGAYKQRLHAEERGWTQEFGPTFAMARDLQLRGPANVPPRRKLEGRKKCLWQKLLL